MWVSDCLQGKYKGLEKAAQIYNASLEQPIYFRLVILELLENLTSGDETIRKNSLWMLTNIVEEQHEYSFMSPTVQILISSLQEKNQAIRYFTLKIINQITSSYYEEFRSALPQIANNLKHSSSKLKLLAAAIITQFIEIDSNLMESVIGLLVQALKSKDLEIREVAIRALLHMDQHVDQVVQSIMESFQDDQFRTDMIKHIFDFIKHSPVKVIDALRNTIKKKDNIIRQNSIIFLHQIAESKHVDEVIRVIPELIKTLTDKNKIIRRTATRILYLLSKNNARSLYQGIDKFIQHLKIKNRQLLTYFIHILIHMLKYFPNELSNQIDPLIKILEKSREWEEVEPEITIINVISLCSLYRYKNQFALALNIAQDCVREYKFDKAIFEVYLFLGYTHYYLGDYSDSIQAFLKAETAHKRDDYYTATIATIMIAFNFALLRTFDSSFDYKKDAEKYYTLAKDRVSIHQSQKLQFLMDFISAIATHDFETAQSALQSYHEVLSVSHPFDQKLQLINLENVRKVKKYYEEAQEILEDLKKNNSDEEPPVLNEK